MTSIFRPQAHNMPASCHQVETAAPHGASRGLHPTKGAAVTSGQTPIGMRYLRAFSYLLGLCGVIGCVAGIAIVYQAFADGGAAEVSLPLGSAVFGIAAIAAEGVTIAAGVLGVAASCNQRRAGALYTTALAGLVATALGLGLCYATGAGVPTSLVFNGLLMVICAVIANNLRKSPPQDGPTL